jgi:glutathione S-transferase
MLRLWGRTSSINVRKVLWTLQELGLPFERIDAGLAYGHNHTPAYLAKNPNALVPLLEEGDFTLWESNAIVRYLAASHAMGTLCCRRRWHSALSPNSGWTGSRRHSTAPAAKPSSS